MAQAGDRKAVEQKLQELKASIGKYLAGEAHPTSEVAADLTKAIHDLSDHLVDLSHRIEKLEDTHEEWTTRGWEAPPGSDDLS